jgi:hypothetical protein
MEALIPQATSREITDFKGPNLLLDEEDIRAPYAIVAQNVEYLEGSARTRRGFTPTFIPASPIKSFHNWLVSNFNRLLYLNAANQVISRDLSSGAELTVIDPVSGGTNDMLCAQQGSRIFMAFPDVNLVAAMDARVWNGVAGQVDVVARTPMTTADFTFTSNSAPSLGNVDAGTRKILLLFTTNNGYTVAPSPVGAPYTVTTPGGKILRIVVTPTGTWPSWIGATGLNANPVQPIMTTAQNNELYFKVPTGFFVHNFLPGTAFPITIDINISDTTLASSTQDATEYFSLYNAINPFMMARYGERMVYLTRIFNGNIIDYEDTLFFSEINQPQYVTLAYHSRKLPEARKIASGAAMGSSFYVYGPQGTFAFADNTRKPLTWAAPREIDGKIGTHFPRGISPNSARGYTWVADTTGLYCFRGSVYEDRPASYLADSHWRRINFAAPGNALSVIEDVANRMVMVGVPLDGATSMTHIMVWDYSQGTAWDKVKYGGLWPIAPCSTISCLGNVQAYANKRKEIWLAGPVKVYRQKYTPLDSLANIYDDDGSGIDSYYRPGSLIGVMSAPVQVIGSHVRARGGGAVQFRYYTFDQERFHPARSIQVNSAPGKLYFLGCDVQSEAISLDVSNGGLAGSYFILSYIKVYYLPWLAAR